LTDDGDGKSVMVLRNRSIRPAVTESGMKGLLGVLMAGALTLLAVAADAQSYPSKPISFVVPFGPGNGSDLIGRIIGQRLGVVLSQSAIRPSS